MLYTQKKKISEPSIIQLHTLFLPLPTVLYKGCVNCPLDLYCGIIIFGHGFCRFCSLTLAFVFAQNSSSIGSEIKCGPGTTSCCLLPRRTVVRVVFLKILVAIFFPYSYLIISTTLPKSLRYKYFGE